ncbi:PREDICTED: F-box/kelch-repeat protein At1g24800-like [Camelina sativa]|uniref:F-box/kelch-repeat protein At1g24800-like n=1 Tax=Camelina sativa TaxID=90675 RepID=A0ABM0VY55_CAMSA|nr:PREDICTED: F-box/kelch-repeat protein At1g24800-like [Camelina sativa]
MTRMCDLPPELVGMIFTKIPITSVRAIRSTCKLWKGLTNDWVLGKGSAKEQFLGFVTMDSKVCSLRFHICRKNNGKDDEDLLDLSIKQVDLLNQVDIYKMYHCDGLLLCVDKSRSRLIVWNPYLGQTRWITSITNFHKRDKYVLGYDINHNHKILRIVDNYKYYGTKHYLRYEIYDFRSSLWRVLDVTPDRKILNLERCVSLKGNFYLVAHEIILRFSWRPRYRRPNLSSQMPDEDTWIQNRGDFLLCFDFTKEIFGPPLPLPFNSNTNDSVDLSCVKEEQLMVLYLNFSNILLQIWITTTTEPNTLSWSKFSRVEMTPFALKALRFGLPAASFFFDEQEKFVAVFYVDRFLQTKTAPYYKAFIIGKDGYFKSVTFGDSSKLGIPCRISGRISDLYCPPPPLVCSSSYLPSLVQLNQPRQRKERDD